MKIERLPGPFGAEVSEVDLATCSDDDLSAILRAIYDERFAVIRTGGMNDQDLVRFGYRCGTPVRFDETADCPEILHVSNEGVDTIELRQGRRALAHRPVLHARQGVVHDAVLRGRTQGRR